MCAETDRLAEIPLLISEYKVIKFSFVYYKTCLVFLCFHTSYWLCFSCDPELFQTVCTVICVRSRMEAQQLVSLLQLQDFTLLLSRELKRKTCRSVGRVLKLCPSKVDLTLTPSKMSIRATSDLFRHTTKLNNLRYTFQHCCLFFLQQSIYCDLNLHCCCNPLCLWFSGFLQAWPCSCLSG